MKKLFFAFIVILSMSMEAQNITDAVRYSTTDLNGTARYRAMSGAFGALGGDLSSINVNPAGSAVFLNSTASFTLNIENSDSEVNYMNGYSSNTDTNLDLGQAGAAFVFNNRSEDAAWKKFTLGFNYNKAASFEDDWMAAGDNSNSIDKYFLGFAQGIKVDNLVRQGNETEDDLYSYLGENLGFAAQQAFLGLNGGIIGVNNPDNIPESDPAYYDLDTYSSIMSPGPYDQKYSLVSTGLNGKFSFNFATQYEDFLYLGVNLNSHFINFERTTVIDELNTNDRAEYVYFENSLNTLGSGFSFQLGGLAKIGESLRVGAAYESPTWYRISEETTQYVETDLATLNLNVINVYPDYDLQTPSIYTGSLAYLFGDQALISFDYSYKDYSSTKFKPKDDPAFAFQNDLMQNELKGASTFRVGGEYRLLDWSFRGGYRFEESPYSDGVTIGDLQGYSLGLGYNFGNIKLDVAYDAIEQDFAPRLYQTGLTDRAFINKNNSNVTVSLSFGI